MIKGTLIAIFCVVTAFYTYKYISGSIKTEQSECGEPCISFEHFLAMYKVNPDKWRLKDSWNDYYEAGVIYNKQPGLYGSVILYWETIRDKRKFKRWVAEKAWIEKTSASNEALLEVLNDVQKDIDVKMKEIDANTKKELSRIEKERTGKMGVKSS